ncbi:MAG: hypothetical protein BJ554DRAFT_5307, partial [Olpidium bornovanus]
MAVARRRAEEGDEGGSRAAARQAWGAIRSGRFLVCFGGWAMAAQRLWRQGCGRRGGSAGT